MFASYMYRVGWTNTCSADLCSAKWSVHSEKLRHCCPGELREPTFQQLLPLPLLCCLQSRVFHIPTWELYISPLNHAYNVFFCCGEGDQIVQTNFLTEYSLRGERENNLKNSNSKKMPKKNEWANVWRG